MDAPPLTTCPNCGESVTPLPDGIVICMNNACLGTRAWQPEPEPEPQEEYEHGGEA